VSTDYLSLQAADHITRTLQVLEPVLKRRVERRYLLTRFDRRRRMSDDVRNKLRERYGNEVLDTVISENVAVAESPSLNQDVFRHNPTSTGAQDYKNMLAELVDRKDL
jgi:chromosome partitioning protein